MSRTLARYVALVGLFGLGSGACTENANDLGYGEDGLASGGSGGTGGAGGSAQSGGVPSTSGGNSGAAGVSGAGGSGGGLSCNTPADCPATGSICSEATCIAGKCGIVDVCHPSDGGSRTDDGGAPTELDGASTSFYCGEVLCLPTTCAGFGCGAPRCCETDSGSVCVHGGSPCPGELATQPLQCWSNTTVETFAKSCTTTSDCFVAKHYTGCCAVSAVGLNVSELDAFNAFEQSCGGAPPCGCCCDQTIAENEAYVPGGSDAIVECAAGVCVTRSQ